MNRISIVWRHLAFVGLSATVLLVIQSLLRLALLAYNRAQLDTVSGPDLIESFVNGLRFDLRLVAFLVIPLVLAMAHPGWMHRRRLMQNGLIAIGSLTVFLGVVELDFYREFNQRLNGLVFQYLKEDPKTVLSMLWYGFPVVRLLLAWALATWLIVRVFGWLDRTTALEEATPVTARVRIAVMMLCLAMVAIAARGTLRQGAPLRWGDAFTTSSMFANQMGLNGTLSLANAAVAEWSPQKNNRWQAKIPISEAKDLVRSLLVTPHDRLIDADQAAIRRDFTPPADQTLPVRNVVIILMESMAGFHIGALGASGNITPHFDKLAEEGVLFTRFFSNGTHTHQGMFATFACFPNLPGFEYLMKQQESRHRFSGLPQLLAARGYDNLYVYNGDFAWDNQSGFFGKQGVTRYIGRFEFVNPIVFDPTWGVSDQDMFDRAAEELAKMPRERPFYAMLQTLSNHTPYPLPPRLPVEPVTGQGNLDEHLTAMRYSDWALGQFFEKARTQPYFRETLFVIVGDHGFSSGVQLTEMHLARFNVPLLVIGPGIQEKFGARRDTVGTQVDIVPTIMGRLGGTTRHQCWGRDLLTLPADDRGFGVIKPSGGEQIVAIVSDDKLLVKSRTTDARTYTYRLGGQPGVAVVEPGAAAVWADMNRQLDAFLKTATQSLLDDTAGATGVQR